MSKFFDDVLKGNQIKELVKVLFEKSGYSVSPYGYESTLSEIKKRLGERGTKNSRTVRRIRYSPDLLVYDGEKMDAMLVEIKMRNAPKETDVVIYDDMQKMTGYKEFWNDSILIVVVPAGNVFYAQRVSELEIKRTYNFVTDFERIEDVFTRISPEEISHFKPQAMQIMKRR